MQSTKWIEATKKDYSSPIVQLCYIGAAAVTCAGMQLKGQGCSDGGIVHYPPLLGLPLGLEALVMTPNSVVFLLFLPTSKYWEASGLFQVSRSS